MSVFECVYVCVCEHTNTPLESCGWVRYVCNAIQYIDPLADNRRKGECMSISLVSHVSCLMSLISCVSLVSTYIHLQTTEERAEASEDMTPLPPHPLQQPVQRVLGVQIRL